MSAVHRDHHDVVLSDGETLQIESVRRDDWHGLSDPCPECGGTEFDHMLFEGGHYGSRGGAVTLRADYWAQKGSLSTTCKDCGTVLYKHPAFDLLHEEQILE